jgi:hypothetical protein
MKVPVAVDDVLVVDSSTEGTIGLIHVTSVDDAGYVVGRLELASKDVAPRAFALFKAADEAAECMNFALMELEEANLAAEGLRIRLPEGNYWELGVEIGALLITGQCSHIAFKLIESLHPGESNRKLQ